MAVVSTTRAPRWNVDGYFVLPPPVIAQPTIPSVTVSRDATIHALVGAQYGDLEFDAGKSVRWAQWFSDTVFITDINTGDQRYWVINWAASFPQALHSVTDINYFVVPTQFRAEQFREAQASALRMADDDWVLFVDASEGMSCDSRSLPNDIGTHPFRSYVFREVARAVAAGQDYSVIPFFVFLRHETSMVTYPHLGGTLLDPDDATSGQVDQPVAVPYYLPYQGLKRLWKVSALKAPGFDWTQLDQPVDWTAAPGTGIPIVHGYLTPSVGRVTTPDPGPLPEACVWVVRTRGPTGTGNAQVVAQQWEPAGQYQWKLSRAPVDGRFTLNLSTTGAAVSSGRQTGVTPLSGGAIQQFAVIRNLDATYEALSVQQSLDDGATYTTVSAASSWVPQVATFDGNGVLRIGQDPSDTATTFNDRIYSVELRTGTDPKGGTVLWRFDADDYPGTGTSYTDPRGRTWTLTSASAITPKVPAIPAAPAVKIQLVSYAYAHWNIQDIVPPATTVEPLALSNDDGFRMRKLISRVRPVTGVPFSDAQWNPSNDPAGTVGPWGFAQPNSPDPVAGTPAPPTVPATTAAILTPLYDLTFRINLRDGLFYAGDSLGNIPLKYDNDTDTWVPVVPPEDWHETDTYVAQVQ